MTLRLEAIPLKHRDKIPLVIPVAAKYRGRFFSVPTLVENVSWRCEKSFIS